MTFRHSISKFTWLTACLAFPLLLTAGCSSSPSEKHLEQLNKVIKVYNNAFESKSYNGGSKYVIADKRKDYLIDYAEIENRVSFNESQILDFRYLKDGEPVSLNAQDPEKEFNEAKVLMRYTILTTPSVTLKTIIIEQNWTYVGDMWQLDPDLKPFLD